MMTCRLSYLHSERIVHRDVKTENMLLDYQRNLKIADFGVARVEAQNPKDMTGETGTLGYMAPEVAKKYNFYVQDCLLLCSKYDLLCNNETCVVRFLMVSHTTEDAMFTASGYACGRFIVVLCLILISVLLMFLLLLFVRLVKLTKAICKC